MRHAFVLFSLILSGHGVSAAPSESFDVVVYGATPAGVAAAVNAAREGASTILVQEDGHIGGLASGGLSNTDFRSFESLGGTFREFMQRVKRHYAETFGEDSQQVIDCVEGGYYEPKVARLVFEQMLDEANVSVLLHHRLKETEVTRTLEVSGSLTDERKRIVAARFTNLKNDAARDIRARVFIDATYEGDLIAAAGVAYRVGCEAKEEYGESLAFDEANNYVQAYNFRVCLTRDPDNRHPLPKPDDYDRSHYAPLIEHIASGRVNALSQQTGDRPVLKIRPMANEKADFNDVEASPISLAVRNVNHPWPDGSPKVRQSIYEFYRDYSLGLFWFLTYDPEVPDEWRREMRQWGLPKDEYPENDHWSPALYVREGRRMVGVYVFTEKDTQPESGQVRARLHPDSIAIGDYSHSSHGVFDPEPGAPPIGVIGKAVAPFQIPYGVLLPKELNGLLAPVPMSASHVGFSALRMEPTWTALGQAAGVAAATAVREDAELRDLDVTHLQLRLHELGAMTVYVSDLGTPTDVPRPAWDRPGTTFRAWLSSVPSASPYFQAAQFFGTKGFFHGLSGPEEIARREPRSPTTGQWRSRYANHFLAPDTPMDVDLARRWLEMAGDLKLQPNLTAEQAVEQELTRGEFLNRLFAEVRE
jgi:hypothetical protein